MPAYRVTYASVSPRGEAIRTLDVQASDDAGALQDARRTLALPTLTYARVRILDCTAATDAPARKDRGRL